MLVRKGESVWREREDVGWVKESVWMREGESVSVDEGR